MNMEPRSAIPELAPLTGPLRILLAEDDMLLAEMLTLQLTEAGCQVRCVPDGRAALAAIAAERFDVLLTDWQMPELDGMALAAYLRAHPPEHYLHIIMMTTQAAQRTVQAALEVEVDAFLHKPVDPLQLELALGSARRIVSLEGRLRRRARHLAAAHGRTREAYARLKQDLDSAASVQRNILPAPRLTGPVRHAAMFLPCYDLGGDSYDMIDLGEGKFLFFLIDVCGHGVQAALRSFLVHHRLAALAPATPDALRHAASDLNDLSIRESGDSYFTMVCGIVDAARGSVSLLRAGHPFPFLVGPDAVVELSNGGPPIGLLPAVSHSVDEFPLLPGQRLILYSDGVTDCPTQSGGCMGEEGLCAHALASAGLPLADYVASLHHLLVTSNKRRRGFEDDLTLLAIECPGEGG